MKNPPMTTARIDAFGVTHVPSAAEASQTTELTSCPQKPQCTQTALRVEHPQCPFKPPKRVVASRPATLPRREPRSPERASAVHAPTPDCRQRGNWQGLSHPGKRGAGQVDSRDSIGIGACSSVYIPRHKFWGIHDSVAFRTGLDTNRRRHRSRILALSCVPYMADRRWRNYEN